MVPSRSPGGITRRHRLWLIACFTAPGGVAALADLFAWSEWLPVLATVAAVLVASRLVLSEEVWTTASLVVKAVVMAAFVASLLWMIAMMFAPRLTVLDLRGEPVVATVVDHDAGRYLNRGSSDDQHCYRLQRTDGSPLFGELCRGWEEFAVGETMTVLVDPGDVIAPETPEKVAEARFWQVGLAGLVGLLATVALCWLAGGLTGRLDSGRPATRWRPRLVRARHRNSSPGPLDPA
ncbi:hypothetical protein ABZV78_06075 [Micromonospora sp. NPDC004540]|uniref:hypothetical protein n=1 Tax=Micromonospora sp. NPDC004540 TaxID=3154457 RepID=UPI0033A79DD9